VSRIRVALHLAVYFVLMAAVFVAANGGWW
jgi:hypothetical protein